MEEVRSQPTTTTKRKTSVATQRAMTQNDSTTTVNDRNGERKRKTVDWLGERLVEKLDRDHYMCVICFKRMSRGYASCHCNEDHQNITDEMKPFIVKAYLNGKKINDEFTDTSRLGSEKGKSTATQTVKQSQATQTQLPEPPQSPHHEGEDASTKDGKGRKSRSKMNPELKKKLEKLEKEGKAVWETKPKKELEKMRTAEGKRVTAEISKILANNGIPFAKSDAIWKIVHEIIGCSNKLGPQVLEKIRFSARTLKRRYDETYGAAARATVPHPTETVGTDGQLPQPTNTQVQNVFATQPGSIVMSTIINDRQMPTAIPPSMPMDLQQ